MNERMVALLSAAVRFSSNEDDFGVFIQGFVAGCIATCPEDKRDELKAAMASVAHVEDALSATATLYESFLASKRATEMKRLREPEFLSRLRGGALQAVAELVSLAAKERKED